MPDTHTYFHVTPKAALANILANGLIPAIGPRATAAQETRPHVWLFRSYTDVETAMLNWLGDELDGLNPVVLKVRLDPAFATTHVRSVPNTFEHVCDTVVPPENVILLGSI